MNIWLHRKGPRFRLTGAMCISQESDVVLAQVEKLQSAVAKLNNDKIALEQSMEMEEEGIVNRLQRQIGELFKAVPLLPDSIFFCCPCLALQKTYTLVLLHLTGGEQ